MKGLCFRICLSTCKPHKLIGFIIKCKLYSPRLDYDSKHRVETDTDTGGDGVGDAETVDTKHAATGTGLAG